MLLGAAESNGTDLESAILPLHGIPAGEVFVCFNQILESVPRDLDAIRDNLFGFSGSGVDVGACFSHGAGRYARRDR